jgi:hypothetical protein
MTFKDFLKENKNCLRKILFAQRDRMYRDIGGFMVRPLILAAFWLSMGIYWSTPHGKRHRYL